MIRIQQNNEGDFTIVLLTWLHSGNRHQEFKVSRKSPYWKRLDQLEKEIEIAFSEMSAKLIFQLKSGNIDYLVMSEDSSWEIRSELLSTDWKIGDWKPRVVIKDE